MNLIIHDFKTIWINFFGFPSLLFMKKKCGAFSRNFLIRKFFHQFSIRKSNEEETFDCTSIETLHNNVAQRTDTKRFSCFTVTENFYYCSCSSKTQIEFSSQIYFRKKLFLLFVLSSCLQYFVNKRFYATISFKGGNKKKHSKCKIIKF